MPKTKDAFALRDFNGDRILQRAWFKDLEFPVADDKNILADYIGNSTDIRKVATKIKCIERLNNSGKEYLRHLRHHLSRLDKIMAIYARGYIDGKNEKLKEQYLRALNLKAFYFEFGNAVNKSFCDNIVSPLFLEGAIDFISLARKTFGERLREARKAAGLTQGQLAALVGLKSYNPITQYERGINDPSLPTLIRLATELNRSVDWLLGLD